MTHLGFPRLAPIVPLPRSPRAGGAPAPVTSSTGAGNPYPMPTTAMEAMATIAAALLREGWTGAEVVQIQRLTYMPLDVVEVAEHTSRLVAESAARLERAMPGIGAL